MKFAYSTSIYRLRPLSEAIEGIARGGFCAIELIAERPHAHPEDMTALQVATLGQVLEKKKLKICNLNGCGASTSGDVRSPSWIEEDWELRERRIRYTLDCMRMAAAMGIPYVSTEAAGVIPHTMNRTDASRLFVANLHRILPLAKKLGVQLLLQPEPGLLLEDSKQTLEFLKEMGFHATLGINFDAGHFFCAGEDPCDAWEKLKSRVFHVHLEDIPASREHRHTQLGEGAMDIPGFLQCVEKSGYEGYVTVKLDAYEQCPDDMVTASAEYLRREGFMPPRAET